MAGTTVYIYTYPMDPHYPQYNIVVYGYDAQGNNSGFETLPYGPIPTGYTIISPTVRVPFNGNTHLFDIPPGQSRYDIPTNSIVSTIPLAYQVTVDGPNGSSTTAMISVEDYNTVVADHASNISIPNVTPVYGIPNPVMNADGFIVFPYTSLDELAVMLGWWMTNAQIAAANGIQMILSGKRFGLYPQDGYDTTLYVTEFDALHTGFGVYPPVLDVSGNTIHVAGKSGDVYDLTIHDEGYIRSLLSHVSAAQWSFNPATDVGTFAGYSYIPQATIDGVIAALKSLSCDGALPIVKPAQLVISKLQRVFTRFSSQRLTPQA